MYVFSHLTYKEEALGTIENAISYDFAGFFFGWFGLGWRQKKRSVNVSRPLIKV